LVQRQLRLFARRTSEMHSSALQSYGYCRQSYQESSDFTITIRGSNLSLMKMALMIQ
jgi:hypothetical protein